MRRFVRAGLEANMKVRLRLRFMTSKPVSTLWTAVADNLRRAGEWWGGSRVLRGQRSP